MSLAPGSRVGGYEVVARLGAGGMGEVFRARDVRLKRDVALKILRAPNLTSRDLLSRFEREAQVLAALNHPNVAQVFGIESYDGTPVIAMEFVEGRTLADRLVAGPLPVTDALAIASQLCDGLEAAHERGIIHRDLKPANISLRADGQVKILDFGLARDTVDAGSDAPTALADHTAEGIVMGTAPYMSPEQARGLAVDKRTDIWAFGCVLYEMLAGMRAFAGATTTDTLIAVVQQAPDWTRLPPALPPRIVDLLGRCLAKNPKERQRDIADARFEIERARLGGGESGVAATAASLPRRGWLLPFAAGIAAAASLYALATLRPRPEEPRPVVRSAITLPPDTTLALSRGAALALSPDGTRLVFAGRTKSGVKLYLRSLDRFDVQELPGTDDATNPFFSRDGKWIGFFVTNKLLKVPVDGGSPIALAGVSNARGHAWGGDDTILVTPANNQPIFRIPAAGGQLSPVTTLREGELSHRWPAILPDGSLLFSIWNDTGWESARLVAERAGSGERVEIVPAGAGYPRYVRDGVNRRGYLIYARDSGLLAAPFDESRLAVTGQAVPVLDGLNTNLSGGAHFDISPSGTLAYLPGTLSEGQRELRWVYPDGRSEPGLAANMGRFFAVSPDDTKVARNGTAGPTRNVFVEDLTRKTTTVLTQQDGNFSVVWSLDSKWLYIARGIPNGNLYRRAADGSDREDRLTSSPNGQFPSALSSDGKSLVYVESDPVNSSDIWVLTLPEATPAGNESARAPAATPRPFLRTKSAETNPTFSPDGKWIAYQSNESGRFEVYVRSFPDAATRIQVSTAGGTWPVWAPSGSHLYFRTMTGQLMAAAVRGNGPLLFDAPHQLFDASGYENHYSVASDGKRFLMMPVIPADSAPSQLRLVVNFLDELRQRVR